jgi:tRNA nucleotidyltransferase/poly(A) polymerase
MFTLMHAPKKTAIEPKELLIESIFDEDALEDQFTRFKDALESQQDKENEVAMFFALGTFCFSVANALPTKKANQYAALAYQYFIAGIESDALENKNLSNDDRRIVFETFLKLMKSFSLYVTKSSDIGLQDIYANHVAEFTSQLALAPTTSHYYVERGLAYLKLAKHFSALIDFSVAQWLVKCGLDPAPQLDLKTINILKLPTLLVRSFDCDLTNITNRHELFCEFSKTLASEFGSKNDLTDRDLVQSISLIAEFSIAIEEKEALIKERSLAIFSEETLALIVKNANTILINLNPDSKISSADILTILSILETSFIQMQLRLAVEAAYQSTSIAQGFLTFLEKIYPQANATIELIESYISVKILSNTEINALKEVVTANHVNLESTVPPVATVDTCGSFEKPKKSKKAKKAVKKAFTIQKSSCPPVSIAQKVAEAAHDKKLREEAYAIEMANLRADQQDKASDYPSLSIASSAIFAPSKSTISYDKIVSMHAKATTVSNGSASVSVKLAKVELVEETKINFDDLNAEIVDSSFPIISEVMGSPEPAQMLDLSLQTLRVSVDVPINMPSELNQTLKKISGLTYLYGGLARDTLIKYRFDGNHGVLKSISDASGSPASVSELHLLKNEILLTGEDDVDVCSSVKISDVVARFPNASKALLEDLAHLSIQIDDAKMPIKMDIHHSKLLESTINQTDAETLQAKANSLDFTINTFFYDGEYFYAPIEGALQDLNKPYLVTVNKDSQASFQEDPIRMFRLIYLSSTLEHIKRISHLNIRAVKCSLPALKRYIEGDIDKISELERSQSDEMNYLHLINAQVVRVNSWMNKLLSGPHWLRNLKDLIYLGMFEVLFPALSQAFENAEIKKLTIDMLTIARNNYLKSQFQPAYLVKAKFSLNEIYSIFIFVQSHYFNPLNSSVKELCDECPVLRVNFSDRFVPNIRAAKAVHDQLTGEANPVAELIYQPVSFISRSATPPTHLHAIPNNQTGLPGFSSSSPAISYDKQLQSLLNNANFSTRKAPTFYNHPSRNSQQAIHKSHSSTSLREVDNVHGFFYSDSCGNKLAHPLPSSNFLLPTPSPSPTHQSSARRRAHKSTSQQLLQLRQAQVCEQVTPTLPQNVKY